jgi:hypothetical protein
MSLVQSYACCNARFGSLVGPHCSPTGLTHLNPEWAPCKYNQAMPHSAGGPPAWSPAACPLPPRWSRPGTRRPALTDAVICAAHSPSASCTAEQP